jgi:hypothetical protein
LGKAFRRRKALLRFLPRDLGSARSSRWAAGEISQLEGSAEIHGVVKCRDAALQYGQIYPRNVAGTALPLRSQLPRRQANGAFAGREWKTFSRIISLENNARVVGRPGFEPGTNCLKGNCSTIELPAPSPERRGKMGFGSRGLQEISPRMHCRDH